MIFAQGQSEIGLYALATDDLCGGNPIPEGVQLYEAMLTVEVAFNIFMTFGFNDLLVTTLFLNFIFFRDQYLFFC